MVEVFIAGGEVIEVVDAVRLDGENMEAGWGCGMQKCMV